jgi:hypothetical protein
MPLSGSRFKLSMGEVPDVRDPLIFNTRQDLMAGCSIPLR